MSEKRDITVIGESLIELTAEGSMNASPSLSKYYGGDTLTAAIAALRSGAKVGFISRVGLDSFKDYLLESWQEEGLDISFVKPADGANGLYIISKSRSGEGNEFSYYRKKTAATNLCAEDISPEYIKNTSVLYSTGVTQSLSISAREAVLKAFKIAKENNVITAYAPNFTPKITSESESKEEFEELTEFIDILFLNMESDGKIAGEAESPENLTKYLWDKGISTVIIKSRTDNGVFAGSGGKIEFVKFPEDFTPEDTTGTSDTFNGAVLYGISSGMSVFKSVSYALVVAGLQSQNYGAIKSIPSKEAVMRIFKAQND